MSISNIPAVGPKVELLANTDCKCGGNCICGQDILPK